MFDIEFIGIPSLFSTDFKQLMKVMYSKNFPLVVLCQKSGVCSLPQSFARRQPLSCIFSAILGCRRNPFPLLNLVHLLVNELLPWDYQPLSVWHLLLLLCSNSVLLRGLFLSGRHSPSRWHCPLFRSMSLFLLQRLFPCGHLKLSMRLLRLFLFSNPDLPRGLISRGRRSSSRWQLALFLSSRSTGLKRFFF